jgi:hypothetical protein
VWRRVLPLSSSLSIHTHLFTHSWWIHS